MVRNSEVLEVWVPGMAADHHGGGKYSTRRDYVSSVVSPSDEKHKEFHNMKITCRATHCLPFCYLTSVQRSVVHTVPGCRGGAPVSFSFWYNMGCEHSSSCTEIALIDMLTS